jgi:hypothetical protein
METHERIKDYRTIGGWLMLLQIFIILNGISWLRNLQLFYGLLGEKEKLMNEMQVADTSLYTSFIYFEIASAIIMLMFTAALIYFMFRRTKMFKLFMIIYLVVEIILELIVFFVYGSLTQTQGGLPVEKLIFTTVIAALITFYIMTSERVKLTFIK